MNFDYRTLRANRDTGHIQVNEEDIDAPDNSRQLLEQANALGQDGWELVSVDGGTWFFKRAKGSSAASVVNRPRPY